MRQIIIIPGIMGTVLKQGNLTIWPGRSYHSDIYYRLIDGTKIEEGSLEKHYYKKLENYLKDIADTVTPFPYDWRQNNLDQITLLENYLDEKADEIILVAHSMGGLIAKAFLNYFAANNPVVIEKVKKLITLGTPWKGSPFAYRTLKYGIDVFDKLPIVITKTISKKIAPKFESLYQLLPTQSYNQEYVNRKNITFLNIEGKNILDWDDVEKNHYLPLLKENGFSYQKTLDDFYNLLSDSISIDHHEIIGTGYETICMIKENQLHEPEGVFGDGDSTVPILSAISGTPNTYFIKSKHGKLPGHRLSQEIMYKVLNDLPMNGIEGVIYDYEEIANRGFNGRVVKIACPVLVSLIDEQGNYIYGGVGDIPDWEENPLADSDWDVVSLGSTTYILFSDDTYQDNKTIHIEAFDEGITSISIEIYENGQVSKADIFESFEISEEIGAELTITKTIEESQLVIKRHGQESIVVAPKSVVIQDVETIVYPHTDFDILAEKVETIHNGEDYVASGEIELKITETHPGTYDILDTHYSINEGEQHLITLGEMIKLNLVDGENVIKIFSRDVLGNSEPAQIQRFYYIENTKPRIVLSFYQHMYTVQAEFNIEFYDRIGIVPKVEYKFEGLKGIIGNNVFYEGLERQLIIQLTDVFGEVEYIPMLIDEHAVLAVFDGTGDKDNIEALAMGLGMSPIEKILISKTEGRGVYRTLTNEHVREGKQITIYKDNIVAEIIKDGSYRVSFQNLMEDVEVATQTNYIPRFKVYDTSTDNEVRTIKLSAFIKINIDTDVHMTNDYQVNYNDESRSYEVKVLWDTVNTVLSQYWNTERLTSIDLVIREATGAQRTLRVQPVILRK